MGLIHSRASKKRARAEAELAREQARAVRAERKTAERDRRSAKASDSVLRQPTLGDAIRAAKRRREGAS